PDGRLTACSFAAPPPAAASDHARPKIDALGAYWNTPGAFGEFRTWRAAVEPCASCTYLALCRGGCRVVSAHVAGSAAAPDPECPRVVEYAANRRVVRLPVL
ncbi:MAG TPA: SPASM domain-containing protein, partial [Kofleriaceae bacterium]